MSTLLASSNADLEGWRGFLRHLKDGGLVGVAHETLTYFAFPSNY